MTRRRWIQVIAAAAGVAVGVPLASRLARRREPGCEFDGQPFVARYVVRLTDPDDRPHEFCSITCAMRWLERDRRPPRSVQVVDEPSGTMIDAARAHFVRSSVTTNAVVGNRIHAFADREAALEHARRFGGIELTGDDRPFRRP